MDKNSWSIVHHFKCPQGMGLWLNINHPADICFAMSTTVMDSSEHLFLTYTLLKHSQAFWIVLHTYTSTYIPNFENSPGNKRTHLCTCQVGWVEALRNLSFLNSWSFWTCCISWELESVGVCSQCLSCEIVPRSCVIDIANREEA
jgi:hypothetical protein